MAKIGLETPRSMLANATDINFSFSIQTPNGSFQFGNGGYEPHPLSCWEAKQYLKEHTEDFISFKIGLYSREAGGDPIKKAEAIREIVTRFGTLKMLIAPQPRGGADRSARRAAG